MDVADKQNILRELAEELVARGSDERAIRLARMISAQADPTGLIAAGLIDDLIDEQLTNMTRKNQPEKKRYGLIPVIDALKAIKSSPS